jgi:hypothetical protein
MRDLKRNTALIALLTTRHLDFGLRGNLLEDLKRNTAFVTIRTFLHLEIALLMEGMNEWRINEVTNC